MLEMICAEFWSDPPETAINGVQQRVARTPQKVVFKGFFLFRFLILLTSAFHTYIPKN